MTTPRGRNPPPPDDDFDYLSKSNIRVLILKPEPQSNVPPNGPPVNLDIIRKALNWCKIAAAEKSSKRKEELFSNNDSSAVPMEFEKGKTSQDCKLVNYEDSDEDRIGCIIKSFKSRQPPPMPIPVLVPRSRPEYVSTVPDRKFKEETVSRNTERFSDLTLNDSFNYVSKYKENDLPKAPSGKSKLPGRKDSYPEHEYKRPSSRRKHEDDYLSDSSTRSKIHEKRTGYEYKKHKVSCRRKSELDCGESSSRKKDKYSKELEEYEYRRNRSRSSRYKREVDCSSDSSESSYKHRYERRHKRSRSKSSVRSTRKQSSGYRKRYSDSHSDSEAELPIKSRQEANTDSAKEHPDSTEGHIDSVKLHTDSSKGHIDSSKGHIDSAKAHTDSPKAHTVSPKGPTDSAKGPTDSAKGPTDSNKGPTDSNKGPTDSAKGQPDSKRKQGSPKTVETNPDVFEDIEDVDLLPAVFGGSETYYCKVCQLNLNGIACYENHMNGKKHKKALNAQLLRPEALLYQVVGKHSKDPSFMQSLNRNVNFKKSNEIAKIQSTLDRYQDNPLPGLNYIYEILPDDKTDGINYYCELCEAPCKPQSLISHLIGFKHYLNCLKIIEPEYYARVKDRPKKEVDRQVKYRLRQYEKENGRKLISVMNAKVDSRGFPTDEAGPSGHRPLVPEDFSLEAASCIDEYGDYYCKICDAHMNNESMFHAHMVGKRHLKNERKIRIGAPSIPSQGGKGTMKAPPNTPSVLETQLQDFHDTSIVGLNFMRETQNANGEYYTCFICGCCATTDVFDHITSMKHRIKYLETVNENRSIPNDILSIRELEVSTQIREGLVEELCRDIEFKHGRGRVEVYC